MFCSRCTTHRLAWRTPIITYAHLRFGSRCILPVLFHTNHVLICTPSLPSQAPQNWLAASYTAFCHWVGYHIRRLFWHSFGLHSSFLQLQCEVEFATIPCAQLGMWSCGNPFYRPVYILWTLTVPCWIPVLISFYFEDWSSLSDLVFSR